MASAPPWLRAQVRTVAFGLARTDGLRRGGIEASATSSHSLGIYAALHAAGSISPEGALAAAWRAGELIRERGEDAPGGLVVLVGMPEDAVEAIVAEVGGSLRVAARNGGAQFALGGSPDDLARARDMAAEEALQVLDLDAGGALHTDAMAPIVPRMREFVDTLEIRPPEIPYLCHRDAEYIESADGVREALARQLAEPVLWAGSLRRLHRDGARVFVDMGPGDVLYKSVRWVLRDARAIPLEGPHAVGGLGSVREALADAAGGAAPPGRDA